MLALDRRTAAPRPTAPAKQARPPQICLVVATRGRPSLVARTVEAARRQTLRPSSIIVSCPSPEDAGPLAEDPDLRLVHGATGLAAQRNAGLRHVPADTDIVVFFDDDFLPRADWTAAVAGMFARHPDVGAVTGALIADGIKGPGLSVDAAEALIAAAPRQAPDWVIESYIPYGCNMAFRWSAIRGRSFDQRLVLYGWLEDRDFGAALEKSGFRIVKIGAAVGVHLGAKGGRVSGRKLGYSQVVNPLYLHRKGTMPLRAVADHLFRNVSSNVVRALWPEPHVDRRGRLHGNLRGLADVLRGRFDPERAACQ